jgi:hypothetical protein
MIKILEDLSTVTHGYWRIFFKKMIMFFGKCVEY